MTHQDLTVSRPDGDDVSAETGPSPVLRADELEHRRRLAKAAEILGDDTHAGHQRLLDIVDCAIELDPPAGWEPLPEPALATLPRYQLPRYRNSSPDPQLGGERGRVETTSAVSPAASSQDDDCPPFGIVRPRNGLHLVVQ